MRTAAARKVSIVCTRCSHSAVRARARPRAWTPLPRHQLLTASLQWWGSVLPARSTSLKPPRLFTGQVCWPRQVGFQRLEWDGRVQTRPPGGGSVLQRQHAAGGWLERHTIGSVLASLVQTQSGSRASGTSGEGGRCTSREGQAGTSIAQASGRQTLPASRASRPRWAGELGSRE